MKTAQQQQSLTFWALGLYVFVIKCRLYSPDSRQ